MQLGLIGLGRMGGNMRDRIRAAGHEVVGYDHHPDIRDAGSLAEMVGKLQAPRVVWTMVPAGEITESTIDELADLLSAGDLIIDGGNSKFTDDRPRAERLASKGIGYMDCGVSGGIWGSQNGYALMVGGDEKHVQMAMPIFDALKPAGEFGFVHAGPVGAGHYTKMVHNGIE
jgi:6-phosphogluconate dehydrogenase